MNTQQLGAGALRVSLGVILLAHGLLKLFVFTIPGTVAFFESFGLPPFIAYLTIAGEIGIGGVLIIGYQARLSALASLPILIGSTWAHSGNGWLFSNPNGGWEFPLLLVVIALIIVVQGGGRLFQIKGTA